MKQRIVGAFATLTMVGCAAPDGGAPGPADEVSPGTGSTGPAGEASPLEQGMDTAGIDGNIRLFLTDAPAEFDEVWVDVSRVEIGTGTGEDESWVALAEGPMTLDLLTLQNDVTAVLGDASLAPGAYGQLRFIVADAWVVAAGESTPLTIPSGAETGIKIDLDFTAEPDTVYAVVLDFDARESIFQTGAGELKMAPVIKVEYVGVVGEDGLTPLYEAPAEDGAGEDGAGEDGAGEDGAGEDGAGGAENGADDGAREDAGEQAGS